MSIFMIQCICNVFDKQSRTQHDQNHCCEVLWWTSWFYNIINLGGKKIQSNVNVNRQSILSSLIDNNFVVCLSNVVANVVYNVTALWPCDRGVQPLYHQNSVECGWCILGWPFDYLSKGRYLYVYECPYVLYVWNTCTWILRYLRLMISMIHIIVVILVKQ